MTKTSSPSGPFIFNQSHRKSKYDSQNMENERRLCGKGINDGDKYFTFTFTASLTAGGVCDLIIIIIFKIFTFFSSVFLKEPATYFVMKNRIFSNYLPKNFTFLFIHTTHRPPRCLIQQPNSGRPHHLNHLSIHPSTSSCDEIAIFSALRILNSEKLFAKTKKKSEKMKLFKITLMICITHLQFPSHFYCHFLFPLCLSVECL